MSRGRMNLRLQSNAPDDHSAPNGKLQSRAAKPLRKLALVAVVSTLLYTLIAGYTPYFRFSVPITERPILLVLALFALVFALYFWAIRLAARAEQSWRLLTIIFVGAVAFRFLMLTSQPIQEVDIYRHLWDGAVSSVGVSPFRYSPYEVQTASLEQPLDDELRQLVELRDGEPAFATILSRVHYSELPTVYPPVSQAVFAAATCTMPAGGSAWMRLAIMTIWFVAFDLAALVLVVKLLQLAQKPVGLSVIYGWCPLLMKEVANSGHLDAIVVFLTTLAVYLAARLVVRYGQSTDRASSCAIRARSAHVGALTASVVLALAVGAKLYPIVVAPLFLFLFARRLGWKVAASSSCVFAAVTLLLIWPMLPGRQKHEITMVRPDAVTAIDAPPIPDARYQPNDPSRGIEVFLRHWEMNDFIFLLIEENLRPTAEMVPGRVAWFSVVPESIRVRLGTTISGWLDVDPREVPFLLTRAVTSLAFLVLAVCLAWRASRSTSIDDWLRAAFLTIAWFWLLSPTQNPWYWTWALPLLAFANGRAWLAISGLAMLYYLRFWFAYQWPESPVFGSGYTGLAFFDFVVTWIEYAPWFVWLTVEYWRLRNPNTSHNRTRSQEAMSRNLDLAVAPRHAVR